MKTALLTLDMQNGIFQFVPSSDACVPNAARAVEAARKAKMLIIHVGLGFAKGYPEVNPSHPTFGRVTQSGMFVEGSESRDFHPSLVQPDDLKIYKQRVSAFSENTLNMVLRANRIEHLVLLGIATSGIVLSTLRQAADLDYRCTVIKDACFDPDAEVHRVLTEKVFTKQAEVIGVDAFRPS